jgi:hypothetical protein
MEPETFDLLVSNISNHGAFHNNSVSGQEQMPVDRQLLIALQRLGNYGNGASVRKIAQWAGVATGTVYLCMARVLSAILDSDMRERHVVWPEGEERERHKIRAEEITAVKEWRDGWCMIDGTLVPLYAKPSYYGDRFYDRKSNYSLNVQARLLVLNIFCSAFNLTVNLVDHQYPGLENHRLRCWLCR